MEHHEQFPSTIALITRLWHLDTFQSSRNCWDHSADEEVRWILARAKAVAGGARVVAFMDGEVKE